MHSNPIVFQSLHICLPPYRLLTKEKGKNQNKTNKNKPYFVLHLACLSTTYSFATVAFGAAAVLFSTLLPKQINLQLFIVMSHRSGSSLLVSTIPSILDLHQNSSQIAFSCPSHGNPVTMVSWYWSLHSLQQVINGTHVGVHQLKTLGVDLTELVNLGLYRDPSLR